MTYFAGTVRQCDVKKPAILKGGLYHFWVHIAGVHCFICVGFVFFLKIYVSFLALCANRPALQGM